MVYRIKQFIWTIRARVTEDELNWVKTYLAKEEIEIFLKLSAGEQKHSIKVAKLMADEAVNYLKDEIDLISYIKIGLLHDIGKTVYPLNLIKKAIMVLLNKIGRQKFKNYTNINMIRGYYTHPSLGREILEKIGGYEEMFLETIENHHNEDKEDGSNKYIKLLKKYDDIC